MQTTVADSYPILYTEFNVFCALIVTGMLYRTRKSGNSQTLRSFSDCLLISLIFFTTDSLWFLMDQKVMPGSRAPAMFLKSMYFLSGTMLTRAMLLYFHTFSADPSLSMPKRIVSWIPLALHMILLIANLWTGDLFSIDDAMFYQRGELFGSQYICMYLYIILALFFGFVHVEQHREYAEKMRVRRLVLLPLIPVASGIYSLFVRHSPANAAATTACLLLTYLTFMDENISVDPLTKLSNRRYLMNAIDHRMNSDERGSFWLMMIDVNDFKKINDSNGHVEGDKALQRTADALRSVSSSTEGGRPVLARYGGDEFTVLLQAEEEQVRTFAEALEQETEQRNIQAKAPYPLKLSIGWAQCAPEMNTPEQLIRAADQKLYEAKRKAHAGR